LKPLREGLASTRRATPTDVIGQGVICRVSSAIAPQPGELSNALKGAFFVPYVIAQLACFQSFGTKRDGMTEQTLKVQIEGCIQGNETEINQAVENALSNLMALVERGDMEFDGPEDMT
jgi:hypothetical protein